ncbi:MAG: hypothetical protein FWC26_01965 [Fibromonadales bacterium]|nr:hypothetical protein [Fibromonadales bacterium]
MATTVMANETEITNAEKIAIDRALAKSITQADRGEKMPIKEAERIMRERFASGYYDKK